MLEFLNKIKEEHKDDDETLIALDEIENELNSKKYGLVWEKHEEEVDRMMQDNIPVFTEVKEREIKATDENAYNFLLEGDNLHSLKLLEKTHTGKIDVIYIDPPYNTGTDKFKYDDKPVDTNDTFRHSKWTSFMFERLSIAKNLCANNWILFISIDNNEIAPLKMLCDEIFGESNFIGTIDWESKTKSQNTKSAYRKLQPKCEYILCYGSEGTKHKFNLIKTDSKEYNLSDEKGCYREHHLEVMNAGGVRGRKTKEEFRAVTAKMAVQQSLILAPKTATFKIPEQDFFKYDPGVKNEAEYLTNAYREYTSGYATSLVRSTSEMLFEKYCETRDDIEWVYKNGDTGQQYFSIVYVDGLQHQWLFYADYIIKKKNGTIWIIETKGGEARGQDKNIDRQIGNKFNAFKQYAQDKKINWGFVRDKDGSLYINNTIFAEDMADDCWVPLSEKF